MINIWYYHIFETFYIKSWHLMLNMKLLDLLNMSLFLPDLLR